MAIIATRESALLVVDVQRGFTTLCPDELPVPGGLEIVPAINRLLALEWARIDATQDWHPPDHRSFRGQADNLYPPHCVMGTPGADFVPGLDTHRFHAIWRKGFQRDFEAYAVTAQHPSMFALYRGPHPQPLSQGARGAGSPHPQPLSQGARGVEAFVVCGIATNICCYFTARDFRRAGFRVLIVEDASAGIDVPAAGLMQAKTREEGVALGIEYVSTGEII
ncbi:MAG TPA: isochorismatase family protein [Gemmataceae bacterium]|nr:isochorismatase family protein [Gemmataceae bacterium]